MPRQGTSSGLRKGEDRGRTGEEPETAEPALEIFEANDDDAVPPIDDPEVDDAEGRPEAEISPLQTTAKRKRVRGILPLMLIAIVGMVIGFVLVMLI